MLAFKCLSYFPFYLPYSLFGKNTQDKQLTVSLFFQVSETLVVRNGDFLVRDSLTSVGDYVLTCRWDHEVLHFKISKVLVKSNDTKVCCHLGAEQYTVSWWV